eukprot:2394115-Pleurochrysis_carterae.AAC.1
MSLGTLGQTSMHAAGERKSRIGSLGPKLRSASDGDDESRAEARKFRTKRARRDEELRAEVSRCDMRFESQMKA